MRQLEIERRRLLEELQFRSDLEDGYAKRGAQQGAQLKVARSRSIALEESMKHLMRNTARQHQEWAQQHQRQMEDAALEIDALKKLVVAKGKENVALRRTAQEVLLQRSDVEKFLLSSIYMVAPCSAKVCQCALMDL